MIKNNLVGRRVNIVQSAFSESLSHFADENQRELLIITVGNSGAVNGKFLVNLLDTRLEITESGFANCQLKSLNPLRSSFDCYFSIRE